MKKLCCLGFLAFSAAGALGAQQPVNAPTYEIHRDLIRGRVTTDSGRALPGAVVAVTMAPDRQYQMDTTDADGRYEITFEKGTGDYLVHASFPGRIAFRKRVTRTGSDSVFTVDASLKANVQVLAPVQVAARRSRPARETPGSGRQPGVGAAEQSPIGVNGNIAPGAVGNLEAIAGSLPGVSMVQGGGISVLGSAPAANNVTLNGLDFSGGSVPRSASTNTTVSLSTYDPARGGFSGLQTQVSLSPGGANTSKRAASTLDAPQLQAADAIARNSGAVYGGLDLSYGTDGATFGDRWVYNSAVQYKRTYSDAISLANADADVLSRSGISADSVAKLMTALNALGIPLSGSSAPSSRVTNYVNFMGRLDRPFFDFATYTPKPTAWGVLGYANYSHTGAQTLGPTITPATAGEHAVANIGAQYLYSKYIGKQQETLNETRIGVSLSNTQDDPYLRLPNGRVLVSSSFANGSNGIASVGFSGNSSLERQSTTTTIQATNLTRFYWKHRATHPGKVTLESRYDIFSEDLSANRLGAFSFNSLADVQANTPSSFSRTLNTPSRSGGQASGSVAISDNWIPSSRFSVLYGFRVEGNVFTQTPENNPAVESAFGARTDHAPNTVHLSPRAGFNWLLTKASRQAGTSGFGSNMGNFSSMARGVIRGGIGEFRQRFEPSLLASAATSTGLPTGEQRISCVGPSVPTPDWSTWLTDPSTIPTSCVGAPSGFTDAAPAVRLFDKDFAPSRAWRANLSYGSNIGKLVYSIDATYSLNLNQPGTVDLNFAGTPSFTMPVEGGRTVYVPQSSIVAATGAVASSAARTSAAFGPVNSRVSDLRGNAQQIAVRARPGLGFIGGKYLLDMTYTFTRARSQARGFDGASLADPRAIEWAPADNTSRHEIYLQSGWITKWVTFTAVGKVSSGQRFTPMVGSDINGDGLANDRAFVFDGTGGGNAALGSAMQKLLTTSSQAHDCLVAQIGQIAGRNSCEAPWYTTLNLNITPTYQLMSKLKIKRANVDFYISNPLAGLDQALHGSNLRGWGAPRYPDRTLLFVRGYDSTTKSFRYDVNPKFGDTRGSSTAFRSPFRVTLNVRLDFSRNYSEQDIERYLSPGRRGDKRPKLDSAATMKRYCNTFPDMYNDVINQTDSLLLTRDQVESLRAARAVWLPKLMAYWGKRAKELSAQPDNFNVKELAKAEEDFQNGLWALGWTEAKESFPKILTPVQQGLTKITFADLLKAKEPPKGTRSFGADICPK